MRKLDIEVQSMKKQVEFTQREVDQNLRREREIFSQNQQMENEIHWVRNKCVAKFEEFDLKCKALSQHKQEQELQLDQQYQDLKYSKAQHEQELNEMEYMIESL